MQSPIKSWRFTANTIAVFAIVFAISSCSKPGSDSAERTAAKDSTKLVPPPPDMIDRDNVVVNKTGWTAFDSYFEQLEVVFKSAMENGEIPRSEYDELKSRAETLAADKSPERSASESPRKDMAKMVKMAERILFDTQHRDTSRNAPNPAIMALNPIVSIVPAVLSSLSDQDKRQYHEKLANMTRIMQRKMMPDPGGMGGQPPPPGGPPPGGPGGQPPPPPPPPTGGR